MTTVVTYLTGALLGPATETVPLDDRDTLVQVMTKDPYHDAQIRHLQQRVTQLEGLVRSLLLGASRKHFRYVLINQGMKVSETE